VVSESKSPTHNIAKSPAAILAAVLVVPILAASHVQAGRPAGQQSTRQQTVLSQAKADWFAMRTKSAEQQLIAATKSPATAAEAHYWLGRIYDFKGNKAEGAFPGFHEEVSYRARAEAEFKAAGEPKPEWILEASGFDNSLKAADAAIAKLQADPQASPAAIRSAIEERVALRPDPMSYIAGANLLLARNADLPFVLRLAAEGTTAGARFIRENDSSYKLDGKVQASLDRNAAAFADIAGWALFLQGDMTAAEIRLAEAARLFRNADASNQLHLAAWSLKKNDLDTARDHYLTALGLAGITAPQRQQARIALADVQTRAGEDPAEFDAWLTTTLDVRREARRAAFVSNMQGRKLPNLVLKDLQGNNVDLRAERGNVVLLNFFAAW
jgi:tetratricopeptide (TPR) repeat protein